jgi:putative ABC transport system substrate-binding protein
MVLENRDMLAAAGAAGLEARSYGLQGSDEVNDALTAIQHDGTEALVILPSTPGDLQTIISFATNNRLAALWSSRAQVAAGGLMGLGPAYLDLRRRAAAYVDKILRGAKAGDLPVEQPQRFDIALNLATARAMGITFPEPLLLEATEVLQ